MKPPKKALYNKFMEPFRGLPCERSGTEGEPHHIIYKSQSGYMTLVALNIIPLSHVAHVLAHDNKFDFFEWVERKYPDRLEKLNEIKLECRRMRYTHEEIYEKWGKCE